MPSPILQLWRQTVRRKPEAVAVFDRPAGRNWTFSQLDEASDDLAERAWAGVRLQRRRVLLAEPNGGAWVAGFLALLKAGAVPVPVDPTESPEIRANVADATGASGILRGEKLEARPRGRPVRRADVALIKLTSGSTGVPKALLFSHSAMIADGRQVCSSMGITADDLNLGIIPFGHSYGLGNIVMPLIDQGTAVVAASGPLPQLLAADCRTTGATVFPTVPAILRVLAQTDVDASAFASLRLVISAGSVLPAETAQAFSERFDVPVHGFYGSSETGGITYDRTGAATAEGRSVGTAMDGVTLRFRRGRRFTVASAAVMGRGEFSPKDHGERNTHGELVLLGRAGRVVKIGARRLDLGEIETALCRLPGVKEACALPHPDRDNAIAAVVVTQHKPMEIRRALGQAIAGWKVPDRIVVVPALPLTARGKIDRRALRALAARKNG